MRWQHFSASIRRRCVDGCVRACSPMPTDHRSVPVGGYLVETWRNYAGVPDHSTKTKNRRRGCSKTLTRRLTATATTEYLTGTKSEGVRDMTRGRNEGTIVERKDRSGRVIGYQAQ